MPKKQQYHMKRRHDDVILSFERLQADFLNFGVILAITRLIQGRRPKRQRRAASKSHVGCNKGLKWKSETLTHVATLCRYIFCTDVGLLKLASSYCLLLLYKHLDVFDGSLVLSLFIEEKRWFQVCGATELVEGQSKLLNLEEEFLG